MKSASLFCLLFLLGISALAGPQDEAFSSLKATVRYLDDHSRLDTVIDPDARTAVETHVDPKGRVIKKTTYLLDERNFALGAIHYDARGVVRYKETYARDLQGHVVETKLMSAEGQPLGRRIFSFNGDKPTGVVDYDANGQVITPRVMTTTRPVKKK